MRKVAYMSNRSRNRRGSHAVEFALLFPVFLTLVFGGIDYLWYILQRYELTDAVASGCRTGALVGDDPYADASAIAGQSILNNIGNNVGDCGVGLCSIFIDEATGPTDDVWLLQCSAELIYAPLVGFVPTPDLLTATSTQPVKIPEAEDLDTSY